MMLGFIVAAGCGGSRDPDGEDASPEDAAPADGGPEPSPDSGGDLDARVPDDPDAGRLDSGMEDEDAGLFDAGTDAGAPCEACVASSCHEAACVDGACIESPLADGASCGELMGGVSGVCVGGTCRVRGCGDGYAEPGPTPEDPGAPPREACDDGNVVDGDLCSSMCEPTVFELDEDPEIEHRAELGLRPTAMGVDGEGRVLLTFRRRTSDLGRVLGMRFSAEGAPEGEIFEIADALVFSTVAGLADGGWVVGYTGGVTETRGLRFRFVSPSGEVGPARAVSTHSVDQDVHVAALGPGFVATWVRPETLTDAIYARRFGPTGAPLGAEIRVGVAEIARGLMASGAGDPLDAASPHWVVVWQDGVTSPPIRARRFRGDAPLDGSGVELGVGLSPFVSPAHVGPMAAAALADPTHPRFLVAYQGPAPAARGVRLRALDLGPASGFPEPVIVAGTEADGSAVQHPSVVPMARAHGGAVAGLPPSVAAFRFRAMLGGTFRPTVAPTAPVDPDAAMTLNDALSIARHEYSIAASPRGTWLAWRHDEWGGPLSIFLLPSH